MLSLLVISASLAQPPATEPATPPPYAEMVLAALVEATPALVNKRGRELRGLLKGEHSTIVVVELQIGADGAVLGESLVLSSKNNALDDAMRRFVLDVEPFAAPDPDTLGGGRSVLCVVRSMMGGSRRKPALVAAVACQKNDQPVLQVAGLSTAINTAKDPSARLLLGWAKEDHGDLKAATRLYREALEGAPQWDLAARALGLALVKTKRVQDAIPFLNTYVEARKGAADATIYAREIERFKKLVAARLAEANRVRERLSKADIALGIRKGYPLLEPCLKSARRARRLAAGVDTLVLSWKIRKDGTAHTVRLEGPESMVLTDHADCIERAVATWRFPKYSAGSEITAMKVPIKVRGARPPQRVPTSTGPSTASSAAQEPIDEPTFSQCERTPAEIQGHIRARNSRIRACIMAERQRAPHAPMPGDLPITFVVDADGPVRGIAVDHRAYRTGPLATCVSQALSGSLLPSQGADCPASFALDLRHLAPHRR